MRVPTGVGLAWDFVFIVARIFFVVARAAARLVLMFVLLFLIFMLALFGASLVGAALVEWLGNPPESIRTGISWAMLAGACAVTLGVVVLGYRRFAFVRWAFGALGSLAYLATGDAAVDVAMRTQPPGAGRIEKTPSGGSVDKSTEPHVLRVNGRPVPWKRRTTERRK